ncbi:hypothetical protein GCM10010517_10490 [Streptosporangium fragile]|uniref:Uncharacterized protein n=1 Tax=Streptosporangium fragile TaxID=46186 RepID=A0ABN3VSJ8_9ACTN
MAAQTRRPGSLMPTATPGIEMRTFSSLCGKAMRTLTHLCVPAFTTALPGLSVVSADIVKGACRGDHCRRRGWYARANGSRATHTDSSHST